ncbi:MAG TPA: ABC transporter substrate-binding protein [Magnetospirillum sp.]|jgi:ABC-type transporter MlaC component|nr:ABC transporter substrate-binding protein [Magnetospirillum sp.]
MLTFLYRMTAALILVAAFAHPVAVTAAEPPVAKELIATLATDAMQTFGVKTLSADERSTLFRDRLLRYSSTKLVSADILGRYWGRFTDGERAEFEGLLVDYVVAIWSGRLADVDPGTKVNVQDAEVVGDKVVVHSVVFAPDEPPAPVDWYVVTADTGANVVVDVQADGVSLIKTMREDFTALLRANGGHAAPLFDAMRKKMAQRAGS